MDIRHRRHTQRWTAYGTYVHVLHRRFLLALRRTGAAGTGSLRSRPSTPVATLPPRPSVTPHPSPSYAHATACGQERGTRGIQLRAVGMPVFCASQILQQTRDNVRFGLCSCFSPLGYLLRTSTLPQAIRRALGVCLFLLELCLGCSGGRILRAPRSHRCMTTTSTVTTKRYT